MKSPAETDRPPVHCWTASAHRIEFARAKAAQPVTSNPQGAARDRLHALLDAIEAQGRPATREELLPILELVDTAFEPRTAARRVVGVLLQVLGGTEA